MKKLFILSLFFQISCVLQAQFETDITKEELKSKKFKERLTFNMGGGLSLGTITNINLQPQVGYRISPRFTYGLGANYQYYKDKRYPSMEPIQVFGGNTFLRCNINANFYLQTEYQALNYAYASTSRQWNDYLMVGGGYSPGAGIYVAGFYLLKYPPNNNIYGAPYVLRVGISF